MSSTNPTQCCASAVGTHCGEGGDESPTPPTTTTTDRGRAGGPRHQSSRQSIGTPAPDRASQLAPPAWPPSVITLFGHLLIKRAVLYLGGGRAQPETKLPTGCCSKNHHASPAVRWFSQKHTELVQQCSTSLRTQGDHPNRI